MTFEEAAAGLATQDQHTYDVVLDAVDKLARSTARERLTPAGTYLNVVKDSGRAGGVTAGDLAFLCGLAERGRVRSVIDRCYPLEQIVAAHRYVETGHKRGHVVITVGPPAAGPVEVFQGVCTHGRTWAGGCTRRRASRCGGDHGDRWRFDL